MAYPRNQVWYSISLVFIEEFEAGGSGHWREHTRASSVGWEPRGWGQESPSYKDSGPRATARGSGLRPSSTPSNLIKPLCSYVVQMLTPTQTKATIWKTGLGTTFISTTFSHVLEHVLKGWMGIFCTLNSSVSPSVNEGSWMTQCEVFFQHSSSRIFSCPGWLVGYSGMTLSLSPHLSSPASALPTSQLKECESYLSCPSGNSNEHVEAQRSWDLHCCTRPQTTGVRGRFKVTQLPWTELQGNP